MVPDKAKTSTLLAYGALGVPLAFAGLPIYVHVPKFYAEAIGMDLALLGSILLFIRLLDAFIDPLIGLMSDRFRRSRTRLMLCAAPILLASYILLFTPPDRANMLWLVGCLALVYLAFSALMINYYAMALDVARSYHDNTRAAMFREGAMLCGVLIASILPGVLLASHKMREAYSLFSLALLPLLAAGLYITLRSAPLPSAHAADSHAPSFMALLADRCAGCCSPVFATLFLPPLPPLCFYSSPLMYFAPTRKAACCSHSTSSAQPSACHSGHMPAGVTASAAHYCWPWEYLSSALSGRGNLEQATSIHLPLSVCCRA